MQVLISVKHLCHSPCLATIQVIRENAQLRKALDGIKGSLAFACDVLTDSSSSAALVHAKEPLLNEKSAYEVQGTNDNLTEADSPSKRQKVC